MTTLDTLLELLPPPWTQEPGSAVARVLDVGALELEVAGEDIDRLRRSHSFDSAFRVGDLAKVIALLGVVPLPWEDGLDLLRPRARALIDARLAGAVGKADIGRFVVDYLVRADAALPVSLVRGLPPLRAWKDAYPETTFELGHDSVRDDPADPHQPLQFVEWPERRRRSSQLGSVPYLHRWTERNGGIFPTSPRIEVVGLTGGRTAVPIVANLTTGQAVGWRGVVGTGRRLVIRRRGDATVAELDDELGDRLDVSDRLFSVSGLRTGEPFGPDDLDDVPHMVQLAQGDNELRYLNAGLHDVDGLDHVAFALAADDLVEGAFDRTAFDRSLFPAGPVAGLAMTWVERAPATFTVRLRRDVVVHNGAPDVDLANELANELATEVVDALARGLDDLRAAGVVAELELRGRLRDQQPQRARVHLPWIRLRPEVGPSGDADRLAVSARFGESPLGSTRFS